MPTKKKRKADELAGQGSFADKLRIRREAMESGEASGKPKPKKKSKKDPNVEAIRKKREERKRKAEQKKKAEKKSKKRDLMMRGRS
jgi:hypothetical protein